MKKAKELAQLQRYVELYQIYEQSGVIVALVDELSEAQATAAYFQGEIGALIEKITPDCKRLKSHLEGGMARLFPQLVEMEYLLGLSPRQCALCDLIASIYAREDVPDLETAIRLAEQNAP